MLLGDTHAGSISAFNLLSNANLLTLGVLVYLLFVPKHLGTNRRSLHFELGADVVLLVGIDNVWCSLVIACIVAASMYLTHGVRITDYSYNLIFSGMLQGTSKFLNDGTTPRPVLSR